MLNKLKSILPEKDHAKDCDCRESGPGDVRECDCGYHSYSQAIDDVEALLPDMLALIREEIGKMKYETYPNSEVENWKDKSKCLDYHNKAIDDILNILI